MVTAKSSKENSEPGPWYWEETGKPPEDRVHDWIDARPWKSTKNKTFNEVVAEVVDSMRAWMEENEDDYEGYIVAVLQDPDGEAVAVLTVTMKDSSTTRL